MDFAVNNSVMRIRVLLSLSVQPSLRSAPQTAKRALLQISCISSAIFSFVASPRLNAVALPQAVPSRRACS